ncbi:YceI family protein [Cytophagaceae bacterium DM2B3-1]|uniref:YceI family protein n=1 Tax=Xanthocytophaga flava TaxID=3048013 RepID=A0AAE3UCR4_9BACT|nr:YceI family protein [Xanthocytophaga flavus]MDJ1472644.1 YceI family protein [Xanthocytophaga flavus]MDJ1485104.1 YceI family protein [Xanthocytophaga flavus]MDJ1497994.1 YceI family protein [Xanthocytophaga flavus]
MATWAIDPLHSEIQFRVKHLVISNVTGSFQKFEGKVEADKEDFSDASIAFSADIDSIFTGNEQRDGHLKSGDFFDAAQHPKLSFQSTSFKKVSGDEFALEGDLSIKGVTKPVKLEVEFGGTTKDLYGNTKAGFEIKGKISRKAFGLTWDAVTEAGGAVVSDEIRLILNVQVAKQA